MVGRHRLALLIPTLLGLLCLSLLPALRFRPAGSSILLVLDFTALVAGLILLFLVPSIPRSVMIRSSMGSLILLVGSLMLLLSFAARDLVPVVWLIGAWLISSGVARSTAARASSLGRLERLLVGLVAAPSLALVLSGLAWSTVPPLRAWALLLPPIGGTLILIRLLLLAPHRQPHPATRVMFLAYALAVASLSLGAGLRARTGLVIPGAVVLNRWTPSLAMEIVGHGLFLVGRGLAIARLLALSQGRRKEWPEDARLEHVSPDRWLESDEVLLICNPDLELTDVVMAGPQGAGRSTEDWLAAGRPDHLLHPEDLHLVQGAARRACADRSSVSLRCRLLQPDGIYRWVELGIRPWPPGAEPPEELFLRLRDAHERFREERRLRRRESELETLYGIASTALGTLNPDRILAATLDRLIRLPGIDVLLVLVRDEPNRPLRLAGSRGLEAELITRLHGSIHLREGILEHDATRFLEDYEDRPEADPSLVEAGLRSLAQLPLHHRSELLGLLVCGSQARITFESLLREHLSDVADELAVALQAARLLQNLARRNRQCTRLSELDEILTEPLHPETFAEEICRRAMSFFGVSRALLYERAPEGHRYDHIADASDRTDVEAPASLDPLRQPWLQQVLDVAKPRRLTDEPGRTVIFETLGIGSGLVLPLALHGSVPALLIVGDPEIRWVFTAEELEMASVLAGRMAWIWERQRLALRLERLERERSTDGR